MDLKELSLRAVAEGIRHGKIDAEAYTRELLLAIQWHDDAIEAWAWLDPAAAIEKARASDRARKPGANLSMLHGVPIAVKDIIATRGIATEMGSPIFRGNVPAENAAVVDRIEQAGAFVLGKTVTTEFAYQKPGKTKNPWNPNHTPGGSSSGSAAAVAARFAPAALGSQTLGSVIRPAAFCGVVGYKPSYGLISRVGVYPFAPGLDHIGVFTRSVGDAALLAHCLLQYDTRDPACLSVGPFAPGNLALRERRAAPHLALVRSPVWELAEEAQQKALFDSAAALRRAGAKVDEVELPPAFNEAQQLSQTVMRCEAAHGFGPLRAAHPDQVSAPINDLVETGGKIVAVDYLHALDTRLALRLSLAKVLEPFDAIITPPAPGEAPEGLTSTGNPAFCSMWTLLGVPAITIPVALGPRKLPLGLQMIGAYLNDQKTLEVAQWCEKQLPFAHRPIA